MNVEETTAVLIFQIVGNTLFEFVYGRTLLSFKDMSVPHEALIHYTAVLQMQRFF